MAINQYLPSLLYLRLCCFILTCLLLCLSAEAGTFSVIGTSRWAHVAYVFDGDTFRTQKGERIRLLGINTPEVAHGKQAEQPYAKQAKQRLMQLIMGKSVRLRLDKEKKDKYGRTLAHIYLRDERWINNILVAEGLAQVYTFAPNFYRTDELLRSESAAIKDMRGLWKSSRFRILDASKVSSRHIGQFRLVRGYVDSVHKWRFETGKLTVSVPRKFRQWFTPGDLPQKGQNVLLHGVIRTSTSNHLYLALHSPYDIE